MWFLLYCLFWLCGSLAGDKRFGSFALVVFLPLTCSDANWSVLVAFPVPEVINFFHTQLS